MFRPSHFWVLSSYTVLDSPVYVYIMSHIYIYHHILSYALLNESLGSAKDFVQVTVFKKIMAITRTLNPAPDAGWVLALTNPAFTTAKSGGGLGAITVGQWWNGDDLNEHKTLAWTEPVTALFYHTSVPQVALLGSHSNQSWLYVGCCNFIAFHPLDRRKREWFLRFDCLICEEYIHQQDN